MSALSLPIDPLGLPLFLTRVGTHQPRHFEDLRPTLGQRVLSPQDILLKYMQTLFTRFYVKIPKPTYAERTEARVQEMFRTRGKISLPSLPKNAGLKRKAAKSVKLFVTPNRPGPGAAKIRPEDYPGPSY